MKSCWLFTKQGDQSGTTCGVKQLGNSAAPARPRTHMLALGFSLIAAFPLPAHRNAHPKQVHQPVVRQTVLNVHRVPGRMEYRQALKVRRVPKHPKIIVTPSTAHRTTATTTPATIQVEPTAWALARTIENMQPVCCKPNAHDDKAKAHGKAKAHDGKAKAKAHVMDNVAFFGAGFSAGQMTGGVANGPSALLEAGLGEAVGNLGKVWCWEDLWFPAMSKAGLYGQPARPKRLIGRGC